MLTPIQELGKGEHGTAWLVEMPDKSKAVYKVDKTSNNSHVKEELYQYAQLKSIGFPVAMHYDLEPFIQMTEFQAIFADTDKISRDRKLLEFVSQYVTHGYHLREYVENSFPSYKSTPIDSPLYDQVKKMMETAFKNKIAVDLQRMNVGYQMVERVPKVIYYDLMPHDEVDLDTRGMVREDVNPFGIIVKACLQTFAPVDHEIYAKLDPTISSPLL